MSTPFQNRLVGTVIVAAVAIIFLPDLLDGDKKTYQVDFDNIPTAPNMNVVLEKKRFPKRDLQNTATEQLSEEVAQDNTLNFIDDSLNENKPDKSNVNKTQSTETLKVVVLEKKTQFKPSEKRPKAKKTIPTKLSGKQAWVIQLGSFRHKNNVNELLSKLKKNGYTAFTKPIKTKNGTLTKVFIGPELRKQTLDKKLPLLKKLTNVQGKVARFYPTK
ncbi:MAG: SPOR domain-containing protein [Colwellia sp.]|nr:SPOR domain-containing protein [Colwellia sp.]